MRKCNSRFDGEYKKYVPLEHRTAVFMFEQRQAGPVYIQPAKMFVGAEVPNPAKTQKLPASRSGVFSAAHPVGRLSFAAVAALVFRFFCTEEHLNVVPMHEQLAVLGRGQRDTRHRPRAFPRRAYQIRR